MRFIVIFLSCMSTLLFCAEPPHIIESEEYAYLKPKPPTLDGFGFFVTGAYTYWTPRLEGLGYLLTGANFAGSVPSTVSRGALKKPDFQFDSGFKVGIGLYPYFDGWDIRAEYTWFQSHDNSRKTTFDPDDPFVQTYYDIPGPTPSNFIAASERWDLKFNVFELNLGRVSIISQYSFLRPFIGLIGMWQDQFLRVRQIFDGNVKQSKQHADIWGVGFEGGINTGWYMNENWSLYGDLTVATLWGQFSVSRFDKLKVINGCDKEIAELLDTVLHYHAVKPAIMTGIGLRWDRGWNDNRIHFTMQGGWEMQVWFDHNYFIYLNDYSPHGDLSFNGITARIRVDF